MRKSIFILMLLSLVSISANAQDTDPFSYNANIIGWKNATSAK